MSLGCGIGQRYELSKLTGVESGSPDIYEIEFPTQAELAAAKAVSVQSRNARLVLPVGLPYGSAGLVPFVSYAPCRRATPHARVPMCVQEHKEHEKVATLLWKDLADRENEKERLRKEEVEREKARVEALEEAAKKKAGGKKEEPKKEEPKKEEPKKTDDKKKPPVVEERQMNI